MNQADSCHTVECHILHAPPPPKEHLSGLSEQYYTY